MKASADLYEKTHTRDFDSLFRAPPSLFRGAPFWSWNNRLDPDQLCRQIEMFKRMGIGGFHMHSRVGMNTPYLGADFMAAVKACVEKARSEGMVAWLYDEDRWPSGAAGGLVTREARYRARHLLFTARPCADETGTTPESRSGAFGVRSGNGRLLARYGVTLRDGCLAHYRRMGRGDEPTAGETTWYAYLELSQPTPWFNNQTYVDTLSPEAVQRFVEVTHERYREVVGSDFGTLIPGIFTDEPQFTRKTVLAFPAEQRDVVMPFTDNFPETYQAAYGEDILDGFPEVIWERADGRASTVRYRFHDHVSERFAAAFADTIGAWCDRYGIALTGHLMEEPTLESQTHALGDAMRSYRSFQLPGIDILCDRHEFTTAKQAQSASHQYGRNGVLSELYGVTGWDFDFTGHKCQGDWQAALGVTVRVHHLSWVSMEGEAKRDYPASIFYQSPWWEKYAAVEDHFARVNVALTRGKPRVRVGVLHPIESYWLCYGPKDQTADEREEREYTFQKLIDWLLHGLVDFDYLCESLLPRQEAEPAGTRFRVGAMVYDVLIVPPMRTIRSTTMDRLEAFADAGGRLVFAGEIPDLVDALPSGRPAQLAARTAREAFSRVRLLAAVEPVRDLDVRREAGGRAAGLVHQIREDGDNRIVFVCNTVRCAGQGNTVVRFRGEWDVVSLNTASGSSVPLASRVAAGWTEVNWFCHPHGHLLVRLTPRDRAARDGNRGKTAVPAERPEPRIVARVEGPVPVTLSEPNALLLDQAEWRLNDGKWNPREEILRLDGRAREALGLPGRGGRMAQPWTEAEDRTVLAALELRFALRCECNVDRPLLALEDPGSAEVFLDGEPVRATPSGWWVDEAIRTVPMPSLQAGDHLLCIRIAYRRKSNVEWCYLLGDFGVRQAGRNARIVAPVRHLDFDAWGRQDLPFYTGNITYHCALDVAETDGLRLRIPHFAGAVIGVSLDGEERPDVAFAPYETDLGTVSAGRHELDLTLYGNRHNAFGALHWAKPSSWVGPGSWRTRGDEWCYEYMSRPVGILSEPRVMGERRAASSA